MTGLDLESFVDDLRESLGEAAHRPTSAQLRRFVNTAFFASLEREEGQFVTFAVALVDHAMLFGHRANTLDWHPIMFERPMPFDPASIAKLAPAIDRRQTLIAVVERDDSLFIAGIIRTNMSRYRFARGESSSGGALVFDPVVLTATDVGTIVVNVGNNRVATITKGALVLGGVDVFKGGRVEIELGGYASGSGLDPGLYLRVLKRVLHNLADRGHGGIVLLLPNAESQYLRYSYRITAASSSLRDVIRFIEGKLHPTIELSPASRPGDREPDPAEIKIIEQRNRAIREHEFERDVASFAADLASVDGALVLLRDLSILGFGAHIQCPHEPSEIPARRAHDSDAEDFDSDTSPLSRLGTRHNAAARFCYYEAGALAFVVSQDGIVSCLARYADAVTLWRPVAMERHWEWHWKRRTTTDDGSG